MNIQNLTATQIASDIQWLKDTECGCVHYFIGNTASNEIDLVIGWHLDEGWHIAWKIGQQSFNNGMQTDMDIDFDMPYDKDTGDVYDTLEEIGESENLEDLVEYMKKTAAKVFAFALEQEPIAEE